ncbi:alpha-soluble nsf attachment protein [Anaeramoeba flamelloides]|uniref:Alpha-soluble nsf attachment protein n=1 Tax=Anaeramoeba flamelloides TaxID=1746091 RepID=A0AAV7Y291_9EUKA|nr:alpha-soluble nsf attachment protein [Anaeramoeba flamelloides]KAJ6229329.1 alpha-soluble nsf attachment protein [Anaeramoeba flamelloides]
MSNKKRADSLVEQANKKLEQRSFFAKSLKYEEAFDLYKRAGNLYKIDKKWSKASEAFLKCSECLKTLNNTLEVASYICESARCLKKIDPEKARNSYLQAIDYYVDCGKFNLAAKYTKNIAEGYEKEKNNIEAIKYFEKAIEYYELAEQNTATRELKLKIAKYLALDGQYEKAIEIYENIAIESLDQEGGIKWTVKEYFTRAVILTLCLGDEENARKTLERYDDLDHTFSRQKEYKFLSELIDAFEEGDPDVLTQVMFEFDKSHKLDDWKITMLIKVKQECKNKPIDELL